MEEVTIDVDDEFSGSVIEKLSVRKGELVEIKSSGLGKTRILAKVPSRGLIGYQGEFMTDTRGTGVLHRVFHSWEPFKGPIPGRRQGVLISMENGNSVAFALAERSEGLALLANNKYALGLQISAATLNHIREKGYGDGKSLANLLADNPDGQALLTYNNCTVGSKISAEALNHTIEEGTGIGQSVAILLTKTDEGLKLLRHNNYALGKLIINRAEMAPDFDEGPRYFEDPEILLEFMKKFPDRRDDIKAEAPAYFEQLKRFSKLRGTCKELNGFKLTQGEEKGIPAYLEKEQMMALCRLSLLASEEKKVQMTQVIEKRSDDDNE